MRPAVVAQKASVAATPVAGSGSPPRALPMALAIPSAMLLIRPGWVALGPTGYGYPNAMLPIALVLKSHGNV
jgi:hypothetical protein